jgi:DNA-directed RNA polymerase subunit RPC12/RpoP
MKEDPTGKRALFTGRVDEDLAAEGKAALFSRRDRRPGKVSIDCSRCGATTHVSRREAARLIAALSLWWPARAFSRRLRCPACHHRTWVNMRYHQPHHR